MRRELREAMKQPTPARGKVSTAKDPSRCDNEKDSHSLPSVPKNRKLDTPSRESSPLLGHG